MSKGVIQVAIKKPGLPIEFTEVGNDIKVFQKLVGGYVEQAALSHWSRGLAMLCNENGKIENLQPNFQMSGDIVVGTVVFMSLLNEDDERDENWHPIKPAHVEFLKKAFEEYDTQSKKS